MSRNVVNKEERFTNEINTKKQLNDNTMRLLEKLQCCEVNKKDLIEAEKEILIKIYNLRIERLENQIREYSQGILIYKS